MIDRMRLSHDVLLTLAYVSQISDPDSVRSRFIESLNGLDGGVTFEFFDRLPPGVPECRVFPITTLRSSFGYAVMVESLEPDKEEHAIFRNAFQFLAALLENRMQALALESKNESLLKEIKIEKSLVRTLLDTLPIGIWVADEKGNILMGNAAGEKIWAGSRYGEYKAWWSDTGKQIEPEDWGIARAIKTGETMIDQEIEIECFDGTHKTILHSAAPLLNAEQRVIGAVGVNQNITERKYAENALRESEEKFKYVFDHSLIGKSITLPSGEMHTNDAFYRMLGYSKDEFLKLKWKEITHPDDIELSQQAIGSLLAGKKDSERFIKRYLHKDGSVVWAEVSTTLRRDKKNNPLYFMSSINDITGRRRAEEDRERLQTQLIQAQKMESIGTLAGGIAHDFNNILSPIVGHTEMLMDDLSEENSAIRNSLKEIYSGALRARDLVQQILAFSRQEKSERKPMKMQPIIKEAMKLIRSTIPTTIAITQNFQADCGPVNADPTQIHQIVMNLAANAYHAMAETGGELKVDLKEIELGEHDLINPDMSPGLYVCLSFADTGEGMSKDVMNRIFEPFFTTKEKGKGTGMGLSVVHGIVKHMKGEIQVYSEPGKGTEFRIYIPIVGSASEKQQTRANLPFETIPGGSERILLVDDEAVIIAMEKQVLERLGYQVTSRTGSMEALEAFRANPDKFDLVITDMSMPKMSGDKLASELVRIRPDIPILLCTGFSETMTDEKIKSLGLRGILMKPMMMKDLAQKIREVLDKRQ